MRIKFLLTSLVTVFMTLQLLSQNFDNLEFGTDKTLDVVSWNIEWFPKNGQVTASNVVDIVQALDADIIGLQEIGDILFFDETVDRLPNYEWHYNQSWHDGLAFLYNTERVQVKDSYVIYDTNAFWDIFPRAPYVTEIIFEGQEFIVINNHLKCCGDEILDLNNSNDEETRRYEALQLLEEYIRTNLFDKNVILLGDFNDNLVDDRENNVFNVFIDNTTDYKFIDLDIAKGTSRDWSYPNWPSHLDHILITKNLFDEYADAASSIETIKLDGYYNGGFSEYDFKVTDHRPVGMKLGAIISSSESLEELDLTVFPNPTNRFLNLSTSSDLKYTLKDISGAILLSSTLRSQLDLAAYADGIYFLTVEDKSGKILTRKISLVR